MRSMLLLALFINNSLTREVDFCYVNEDDPYSLMGTKTSYTFVGGKIRNPIPTNCQPWQIWGIIRHGTHYPGIDKMEKLRSLTKLRQQIIENHMQRRAVVVDWGGHLDGHMCDEDFENLQAWSPDLNLRNEYANHIHQQGVEDTKLLARRLQSSFPELLQPTFDDMTNMNYQFRSTGSPRTQETRDAFVEGLFGNKNAVRSFTPDNPFLMKTFRNCTHWLNGDDVDPDILEEKTKFISSSEFLNAIRNVSRRLGFKYDLSPEAIYTMYDMCRFDKSWNLNKISPWCAAFNKEELKVLEYSEDIDYYYGAGFGRNVNNQLGCIPLQNMFEHFRDIERGEVGSKPKGIFYFTNSMTILSFLNSMDIAKDDQKLLASNYKFLTRRQWRTSFLDPLNANLIAVFFRCPNEESPNKVMFYLQEKPLTYDGCKVGLCDWEYLKNKLGPISNQCNPDFCDSGSAYYKSTITLMSIIFILISIVK